MTDTQRAAFSTAQYTLSRRPRETIPSIAESDLTEQTDDHSSSHQPTHYQYQPDAPAERPSTAARSLTLPRVRTSGGESRDLESWDEVSREIAVYSPVFRVCKVVDRDMIRGTCLELHFARGFH